MTELEEKSEEYANTDWQDWCFEKQPCDNKCVKCRRKQAFQDGYKQGQKDYCNLSLTIVSPSTYLDFSKKIEALEKENTELKSQFKKIQN